MKTIILCGGKGTRLNEETEFKPKPLVEIGGKPILWHIMKIYNTFGYNDFIFALGYKGGSIKDYFLKQKQYTCDFSFTSTENKIGTFFANGEDDNFNIIFAETGLETPHGERVLKLKKYIVENDFMVTYGDGIANIDIEKLVQFHKNHGKLATISGVHPASRWGLVNSDQNGLVTEFAQKPMLYDYVNGGFMVFKKEFFNYLKEGDMIEDAIMRLIPLGQVALYKHEDFWYGMDTYKDFLYLNELWEKDPKWKVWEKSKLSEKNQNTILVTGGAGFIGSHLVNELIEKGQNVVVIDDLSSGKKENINPKAKFYQIDVRDKEIYKIFEKENPKIVFHFAARPLVEDAYKNPYNAIETNIMGTVNILEICRQRENLESIIVVSSDKAYGKSGNLPYKENYALKGDHPYDASKSSADLIAQTYALTYNMPVLITRFSNVYGPGDENFSRIVPGIMEAALKNKELLIRSNGELVREYTYVKDVVDGCIKLSCHKNNFGEAFNFGSTNVLSVVDVVKKAEEFLGTKINFQILNTAKNEIPEQYLDWTKAKEVLGWEPKTEFSEGLKQTFEWFKNKKFVS